MSQTAPRASRIALVATVVAFVVVAGGYRAGKHMAQRDNARAAATAAP
jgi:hypothetical protein